MADKQLEIPGLTPPAPPKPKKQSIPERLTELEARVIHLEADFALLRAQLAGDKEHG
ncbi:unnamed protein product [marine sediment metagenome]|uniref:Uncharacterized protein n=1 Tax=marine sediment metagenome TaxID=412755 RepID=X1Q2Z5_9ZZZZ